MEAQPESIAYFRGEYRPLRDCRVQIDCHTLQYGTGCFEGIRGYWDAEAGRMNLLFLREHFERLRRNARLMMMAAPGLDELIETTCELVRHNAPQHNIYVRPLIYKDSGELGPVLCDLPDAYLCYLLPLEDYLDTSKGLHLCVSSWARLTDNTIPTRVKATGAYLNSSLAKTEATQNGYDEAIFLNDRGQVSEGSAENVFLVRDGVLITPDRTADILEGITRAAILELAADLGIPCEERPVGRSELYLAEEVFLVGTGCQVSWAASIDRRTVGGGRVGPVTGRIQRAYHDAVYGREPNRAGWLTPV